MYVSTSGEYCLICWLARFSLVMTRSITSSMVRGWSAGLGAAAAVAPSPLNARTRTVVAALRIFSLPSVRQTEFNPHARRKIHRLGFALWRLGFYFFRRASRGLLGAIGPNPGHT